MARRLPFSLDPELTCRRGGWTPAVAMFLGLIAGASEGAELPKRTVRVDGSVMEYRLSGSGGPIVVLESGFGGEMSVWDRIFPEIAGNGTVLAYSRPGAGGSSRTSADDDGIRTSEEAARTLKHLLRALHLRPPYLLVGASLGGLYVQKFAQTFPKETAGIVLVDNRPPTFLNACRAAGVKTCANTSTAPSPDWSPYLKATFIGIEPSETLAPKPEQLGKIPITMITATVLTDLPDSAEFLGVWTEEQTRYAQRLKNGRQVFAPGATHESLTNTDARIVVSEIESLRAALRKAGESPSDVPPKPGE